MPQLQCETCSGPIKLENKYVKSVSCQFCGAAYAIDGSGLNARGQGIKLADYPSILHLEQNGKINGRGFRVLGRVRYGYDAGFWEEWQIEWDGDQPPAWLEEDEGYWTLYKRDDMTGKVPSFEQVRVGQTVTIDGMQVFITEKRTGKMVGMEGQFTTVMPVKGEFGYATGTADGKPFSITYWPDGVEIEVGTDLDDGDLVLG